MPTRELLMETKEMLEARLDELKIMVNNPSTPAELRATIKQIQSQLTRINVKLKRQWHQ